MKKFKEFLLEVEDWKDQIATNDETGKKYRVKDIYDFAKSKKEFFIKDLPIKDTDALEWWDKQYDMDNKEHKERMEKADTSVPVLGVRQEDGTISITDGLNRIKKAHHLEKKTTISAYVIDKKDMDNIPSIKENTNEDYDVYLDTLKKKKKKRSKKKAKRYTLPYYGFNLYGYNNNNADGESGGGDGGGGGE
jgi:hypothetical protein